jgi:hypothetical protein
MRIKLLHNLIHLIKRVGPFNLNMFISNLVHVRKKLLALHVACMVFLRHMCKIIYVNHYLVLLIKQVKTY